MQGPEEKRRVGKHAAPERAPEEDVLRDAADVYGDETDIPIRRRKKKKARPSGGETAGGGEPAAKDAAGGAGSKGAPPRAASGKRRSGRKASEKKASGKKRKRPTLAARLRALGANRTYRQPRKLLEIAVDSEDRRVIHVLGRRLSLRAIIALAAALAVIVLVFFNNSNIAVREATVTVVGLEDDLEDFRILAISDLNGRRFGDEQSALLRTINNLDYDAVFFLGDMVGAGGDPEPFYELLNGLAGTDMYFICGDSDPGPYVDTPRDITGTLSQIVLEDWILGAIERGATYVDSPVRLDVGESTIWIAPSTLLNVEAGEFLATWQSQMEQEEEGVLAGLQVDYDTLPVTSYRQRIAQNFYNAFSAMEDGDFYLSLAHQVPSDDILRAAASHSSDEGRYLGAPELVLAGHYCGGVWQLPLLGAFYIPDDSMPRNGWFPAQEDVSGLSTVGETRVYITGGLSVNADTPLMAFRLLNQPEISLLTLTATLPESMLTAE